MRWIMATVFATLLTLVLGAGHYYLWRRLLKDTRLTSRWRKGLTFALLGLGLLLPLAFVLSRVAVEPGLCPLLFGGFFWMGVLFYLALFLGLWDGGRSLWRLVGWAHNRFGGAGGRTTSKTPKTGDETTTDALSEPSSHATKEAPSNPERRVFLARTAAVSSLLGAGTVGAIGVRYARVHIETPEVAVKLSKLPKALSGFRIAVLSDIHLGPTLRGDFARRVVSLTNAMKPDLIALLGDIVDGPVSMLKDEVKPLGGLQARHGVAFVTGNHEYYSGAKEWVQFMKGLGFRVLQNQRVSIGDSHPGGERFDLAGVFDKRAGMFVKSHKQSIEKATQGRDESRELVVLAHQPSQISHVERARPGLQISGHTHGGQIWPWTYAVGLVEPYLCGLYTHTPHTQVFVTRGVGYWGPPIRFMAPAEIPCLVLTSG